MSFGQVSISKSCFELIRSLLPEGKTILEFGSGFGTTQLGKHYKMYSVENQTEWQNAYLKSTTYINCGTKMYDEKYPAPDLPQQKGWYDPEELFDQLPEHYDLMLIDGPGGPRWGRGGFLKHLAKFNTNVPMVFDDINREPEMLLMKEVAKYVNRPYQILESDNTIGYIL
tara:strand:+ start:6613 stop:7122 length:510 start_codon:yes stop_codon:yes gene_type:complete